jgi:glutathione S-transferase
MSSMVLYVDPLWLSPYALSAFVALREKGVEVDVQTVDLSVGEHRREPYRTASLTARIPTLLDDGFYVSESSAIVEYLEDALPGPTFPRLLPLDLRQRARARQVMAFIRSDIGAVRAERSSETVFYKLPVAPLSPAGEAAAAKLIHVATSIVGARGDTAFGAWSIADVDLAFALQRLISNGDPVPPLLRGYVEEQFKRPSVRAYVDHPRAPFAPYDS